MYNALVHCLLIVFFGFLLAFLTFFTFFLITLNLNFLIVVIIVWNSVVVLSWVGPQIFFDDFAQLKVLIIFAEPVEEALCVVVLSGTLVALLTFAALC